MDQPQRYSYAMQAARRDHKSHAVQQPALSCGKLRAVGVPMEQTEATHQSRCKDELWTRFSTHSRPKEKRGKRDAELDPRQADSDQSEKAARRHDHGEGHRQEPHGRWPQLCAPDAYGYHRQDVISSRPRVLKTADKSKHLTAFEVGLSGLRPEQKDRNSQNPSDTMEAESSRFN